MSGCSSARRRMQRIPDHAPGGRAAGHVARCLGCQAEAARYRSLHRHLESLRHDVAGAPADLTSRVMAGIAPRAPEVARPRVDWTTAASAVAIAGMITFIGLRRRAGAARV